MGLPGHRRTSSHKRRRGAHFALKKQNISVDNDGAAHLSHRASLKTGQYKGRVVIKVKVKARKKATS